MPSVLSVYCKDGGQFHVSDDIIKACGVFRNFHARHSIYVDIDEHLFRWVLASRGKDLKTLEKELTDMDDQMLLGIVYATTNLQHQQLGKLAINAVNARMSFRQCNQMFQFWASSLQTLPPLHIFNNNITQ